MILLAAALSSALLSPLSTTAPCHRAVASLTPSRPPRHRPTAMHAPAADWRLFGVEVPVEVDGAGAEAADVSGYNDAARITPALHHAVAERLRVDPEALPVERITLVRKSLLSLIHI